MASNLPYTFSDLQSRINSLVNNDVSTPDSDDDEFELITNLINQAVGKWESSDVMWDELWTTHTHASVVAAGDQDYTLALTDLKFPGGFIKLTLDGKDSWIEVISPEQFQSHGGSAKVAYFTGNNSAGWTLNLGWSPVAGDGTVGATISFPYYKCAYRFTTSDTTAKPEMSDPNFIVYDVAATKSLLESQNNKFSIFNTEAQNCMDNMRIMNEVKPHYQNNSVEDVDAISFGSVIGE